MIPTDPHRVDPEYGQRVCSWCEEEGHDVCECEPNPDIARDMETLRGE